MSCLVNKNYTKNIFFILSSSILSILRDANVTDWIECVHDYKELEMQSVHFWPNVVNA